MLRLRPNPILELPWLIPFPFRKHWRNQISICEPIIRAMNQPRETQSNPAPSSRQTQIHCDQEIGRIPPPRANAGEKDSPVPLTAGYLAHRTKFSNIRGREHQHRRASLVREPRIGPCFFQTQFSRLRLWIAARPPAAKTSETRKVFACFQAFNQVFAVPSIAFSMGAANCRRLLANLSEGPFLKPRLDRLTTIRQG